MGFLLHTGGSNHGNGTFQSRSPSISLVISLIWTALWCFIFKHEIHLLPLISGIKNSHAAIFNLHHLHTFHVWLLVVQLQVYNYGYMGNAFRKNLDTTSIFQSRSLCHINKHGFSFGLYEELDSASNEPPKSKFG